MNPEWFEKRKIESLKKRAEEEESRARAALITGTLIIVLIIFNVFLPDPYHYSMITYFLVACSCMFLLVSMILSNRAQTLKEVVWLFEQEAELKSDEEND